MTTIRIDIDLDLSDEVIQRIVASALAIHNSFVIVNDGVGSAETSDDGYKTIECNSYNGCNPHNLPVYTNREGEIGPEHDAQCTCPACYEDDPEYADQGGSLPANVYQCSCAACSSQDILSPDERKSNQEQEAADAAQCAADDERQASRDEYPLDSEYPYL